jgi:PKD repeat protein
VTDSGGAAGSDSLIATIGNLNPTANATFSTGGNEGDSLSFTSAPTDPGTADTFTYLWDFGDTATSTQQNPTHTYTDDGTFNVSLTVTDDDGGTDTESATVVVTNVVPVVSAGVSSTGPENTALSFTGTFTDAGSSDTHTFVWDFGDSSTDTTTLAPTHTYTAPGTYIVTLTVTDDDGGVASDTTSGVVTNTAPTVTMQSLSSAVEGTSIGYTGSFTDGGTGQTFVWDFGDGSTDTTTLTPSHAYADNGSFTVTFTVTDAGGLIASATDTQLVTNALPVVSTGTPPSGAEGSLLSFNGSFTDPGSADTHTYVWDFGDGGSNTSSLTPAHAYVDDGSYTVSLTVTDDDGGLAAATMTVTVANAPPTVSGLTVPATTDEGTLETMSATYADPGTVDAAALTYQWDFGDSSTDPNAGPVTHQWNDDGSFTVTVTVTDPQGATGTDTATIVVSNVAPTITSTAPLFAIENQLYTYSAAASDPGAADVLTWTADSGTPAWLSINGSSGVLDGSPPVGTEGSYPVTLTVTDDDGGADSQTFAVVVGFADLDEDLMADVWETANGLDPTDPSDASADPDLDGLTNLVEFLGGTDPNVFDGPSVPVLIAPIGDAEVAVTQPQLQLQNSTDNQGDVLTYTFELYDGLAMINLLFTTTVAEGVGTTEVPPDFVLSENTQYAWRASAADPYVSSVFSDLEIFFVNEFNEPPETPVLVGPIEGRGVDTLNPVFTWTDFADVDRDTGEFRFVLEKADGTLVADETVRIEAAERDSTHSLLDALEEDVAYVWRVLATDDHGLDGAWSEDGEFTVNTDNAAPTETLFLDPLDGDVLEEVSPVFVASEATDAEGGVLSYFFEVDTVDTFSSPDRAVGEIPASGTGTVEWDTAEDFVTLRDNTTWLARVRAVDDLGAVSAWDAIEFYVRGPNDPPAMPTLLAPENALSTEITTHSLVASHSVDPEGDAVHYEFRLASDAEGTDVVSEGLDIEAGAGPDGTEDQTSWQVELPGSGTWHWSARAVDELGAASEWADSWAIVVPDVEPPPDLVDACGDCEASFGSARGVRASAALLFAVFALFGTRRRRSA